MNVVKQTATEQQVALRCVDIEKHFSMQKDRQVWRILLGSPSNGRVFKALNGLSFEVPRGKIVGIIGQNGAGKSTLLRVLGGVYQPTRGHVETHGMVAGLFELGGMGNPQLTGREYATRYLSVMGVRHDQLANLLTDVQEFSELADAFDHRVRTYSSGMGARLYFATATVLQEEIYLVDELLAVGDEHFQAKCWQRMRQRLLGNASGVLVTHDWTAILKLCEQAHVIDRGRFVFSGNSDKAVVSYLKIPTPEATVARISENTATIHVAHTGRDVRLRLWIDVLKRAPVDLAVSIELLRIGAGWEIVILADGIPIADEPGSYAVDVFIPDLPLAAAEYSLNIFLSRRKLTPLDPAVSLDMRSWTIGNGLRLLVEGPKCNSSVRLPFVARKAGVAA